MPAGGSRSCTWGYVKRRPPSRPLAAEVEEEVRLEGVEDALGA